MPYITPYREFPSERAWLEWSEQFILSIETLYAPPFDRSSKRAILVRGELLLESGRVWRVADRHKHTSYFQYPLFFRDQVLQPYGSHFTLVIRKVFSQHGVPDRRYLRML
jgi:hypothetical protein